MPSILAAPAPRQSRIVPKLDPSSGQDLRLAEQVEALAALRARLIARDWDRRCGDLADDDLDGGVIPAV